MFIGGPTGPPMAFMAFMLGMPAMLFMAGYGLQTTVCARDEYLGRRVGWSSKVVAVDAQSLDARAIPRLGCALRDGVRNQADWAEASVATKVAHGCV